jgi:cation diffusion facilitator CzcD-associated flavoprotein CzcO
VAIVGAGFGGLAVACQLRAAGHQDFVLYEREADVGGTWLVNSYPGVACDAPSHIYSYSFAQSIDWSRRYSPGNEIQAYLRQCAEQYGILDRIQFGTAVTSATWAGDRWTLGLTDDRHDEADVLVLAVGQLTVPAAPKLSGIENFAGVSFHTARWRHEVDLRDKRVAVVGTGASAIQVIPSIAPEVKHLTVFQRSAPYVLRKSDAVYTPRLQRRYRHVPGLRQLVRRAIWSNWEIVTAGFTRFPFLLRVLARYHERVLKAAIPDLQLRARLRPDVPLAASES